MSRESKDLVEKRKKIDENLFKETALNVGKILMTSVFRWAY